MKFCSRLGLAFLLICSSFLLAYGQTGGLRGTVRTIKGDGIPDATITVKKKGVEIKSTTSDRKGDFVISGIDSGIYNLVIEARGYNPGTLYNVEVKKNKVRELDDRLILSPDQGTQVIIKGSVFDKYGRSLSAAEIKLEKINADGTTKKMGSSISTVSGEFTFRQPEGTAKFRITASYKGATGSKEVEVESAAIYRLAITLDISRDGKELQNGPVAGNIF